MQVFKAFFKIAKNRWRTAAIYFSIYAIVTVLLAATTRDTYTSYFQLTALSIAVTDEDSSAASRALVNYLAGRHKITTLSNAAEALSDQIYYRTIDYALTIPAGFEEKLLSGNTADTLISTVIPQSTASYYADWQITQYLTTLELYLASNMSLDEAIASTDEAIASLPETKVISFHKQEQTINSTVFYYFQYLPYIFILILFSGLAPILVILNSKELKARTVCSSLTPRRRMLELSVGCVLYSLGSWILFMLLAAVMFGKYLFTNSLTMLAMLNSLVFLIFAATTTLFISCFGFNDNILNMAANMIGLSMSFLCGVFVPQSMLPSGVLQAAKFLPAYWYIRANNMLAGFGREVFDMGFYLTCIGIQLLFSAAMFAVTAAAIHKRQRL